VWACLQALLCVKCLTQDSVVYNVLWSGKTPEDFYNISRTVARELGKGFGTVHNRTYLKSRDFERLDIDWTHLKFSERHGITNEFLPNDFFPKFTGSATGNELVLLAEVNGEKLELLRTPLNGEPDFTAFSERLRLFYLEGVRKLIGA